MGTLSKEDFGALLWLFTFGIVVAAAAGLFFGAGFTVLTDPHPAAQPKDPAITAQALQADAISAPGTDNSAQGSPPDFPIDRVAAIATPDVPSKQAALASRSTAIEVALSPPARIATTKKVRVVRYYRQVTGRRWAALWRLNAYPGPNPGGGFYGPPNVNIGYINPR